MPSPRPATNYYAETSGYAVTATITTHSEEVTRTFEMSVVPMPDWREPNKGALDGKKIAEYGEIRLLASSLASENWTPSNGDNIAFDGTLWRVERVRYANDEYVAEVARKQKATGVTS